MIPLDQLVFRFVISMALGAVIGLERELLGKEAGVRTSMMVAGGAAVFTMIGLSIPAIVAPEDTRQFIIGNSGFLSIIGNIVAGIGFLGAGIIIKNSNHVHNLTTAAVIWVTAAIGTTVGLGLIAFATVASAIIFMVLWILSGSPAPGKKTAKK